MKAVISTRLGQQNLLHQSEIPVRNWMKLPTNWRRSSSSSIGNGNSYSLYSGFRPAASD